MRTALLVLGLIITAFGFLFILQGLGYVHWPKSSSMLDQRVWADRGAGVVVIGLVLVLLARWLIRRKRQAEAGTLAGRARH